jgi:hypothetical protein
MALVQSSVVVRSRFPAARAVVVEAAVRTVAATGQAIVDDATSRMHPGYFEDTGLSKETTAYEQLTPTSGAAHIPTRYASGPEFGTAHMAARPVLRPAVAAQWPTALFRLWAQARSGFHLGGRQVLPTAPAPGPLRPPIDRQGGQQP